MDVVEEQFELLLPVSVRNDDGHAATGAAMRRHGPAAREHSLGTLKPHSDWISLYSTIGHYATTYLIVALCLSPGQVSLVHVDPAH